MPMSQPPHFAHPGSTGWTADMSRLAASTRSLSRNNAVGQPGKKTQESTTTTLLPERLKLCTALCGLPVV